MTLKNVIVTNRLKTCFTSQEALSKENSKTRGCFEGVVPFSIFLWCGANVDLNLTKFTGDEHMSRVVNSTEGGRVG